MTLTRWRNSRKYSSFDLQIEVQTNRHELAEVEVENLVNEESSEQHTELGRGRSLTWCPGADHQCQSPGQTSAGAGSPSPGTPARTWPGPFETVLGGSSLGLLVSED